MKLTVNGNINRYYAETLCLIYFPGEKFPDDEAARAAESTVCEFSVHDTPDGAAASVTLTADGRTASSEKTCSTSELALADADKCAKIAAGRALQCAATELTGYIPPWGILTGVRPARVASALLDSGKTPAECAAYLTSVYGASDDKSSLAVSVAESERRFILPDENGRCSIYIAIPFCPTKCRYCSFVSVASPRLFSLIPEYLDALCLDITAVADTVRELGLAVASIYVGGGTPAILTESQIDRLLAHVRREFGDNAAELDFEAGRPDVISDEKMRILRANGVNRVSVNTQTLNPQILENIGRSHTPEQFFRAFDAARAAGIPQINVDLIAGLPGESADSFADSLGRVAALRPENVTVHTFTVKKSSEFKEEGVFSRENTDAGISVSRAQKMLCAEGYAPYYMYRQKNTVANLENTGYALPGCEGLYNIYMMEEVHTVFGVGASSVTRMTLTDKASGKQEIERIFEMKYPYEYLKDHAGDVGRERRDLMRSRAVEFYKNHG